MDTDTGTPMPEPYLVGLDLAGRRVVVVGGGSVAQRRLVGLLAAGAMVEVVAPHVTPAVEAMASEVATALRWTARPYRDGDLDALLGGGSPAIALTNLTRQLAWRGVPAVGKSLTMDVYGAPGALWVLHAAARTTRIPLPFGTWWLDPSTSVVAGGGVLDVRGRAAMRLMVPATFPRAPKRWWLTCPPAGTPWASTVPPRGTTVWKTASLATVPETGRTSARRARKTARTSASRLDSTSSM